MHLQGKKPAFYIVRASTKVVAYMCIKEKKTVENLKEWITR